MDLDTLSTALVTVASQYVGYLALRSEVRRLAERLAKHEARCETCEERITRLELASSRVAAR